MMSNRGKLLAGILAALTIITSVIAILQFSGFQRFQCLWSNCDPTATVPPIVTDSPPTFAVPPTIASSPTITPDPIVQFHQYTRTLIRYICPSDWPQQVFLLYDGCVDSSQSPQNYFTTVTIKDQTSAKDSDSQKFNFLDTWLRNQCGSVVNGPAPTFTRESYNGIDWEPYRATCTTTSGVTRSGTLYASYHSTNTYYILISCPQASSTPLYRIYYFPMLRGYSYLT
jgi:hypothetical protein